MSEAKTVSLPGSATHSKLNPFVHEFVISTKNTSFPNPTLFEVESFAVTVILVVVLIKKFEIPKYIKLL